jgi:hypothetical protein
MARALSRAFCCSALSWSQARNPKSNRGFLVALDTAVSIQSHGQCRLQITHCDDEHLIRLNQKEASLLVDACVMVILAAETAPETALRPDLAGLLATLFEHLSPVVH